MAIHRGSSTGCLLMHSHGNGPLPAMITDGCRDRKGGSLRTIFAKGLAIPLCAPGGHPLSVAALTAWGCWRASFSMCLMLPDDTCAPGSTMQSSSTCFCSANCPGHKRLVGSHALCPWCRRPCLLSPGREYPFLLFVAPTSPFVGILFLLFSCLVSVEPKQYLGVRV